ncbi:MAG: hypothetical protein KDJ65_27665, partial [Anaerolineae bacterium]|nr:hypothetical protein [Anaerolineae bacterium]
CPIEHPIDAFAGLMFKKNLGSNATTISCRATVNVEVDKYLCFTPYCFFRLITIIHIHHEFTTSNQCNYAPKTAGCDLLFSVITKQKLITEGQSSCRCKILPSRMDE